MISLNTALDLKIFSPSQPLGLLILSLGLIFTGMIFYIIYAVSTNKESLEDKKIRTKKETLQQEKIGRLFPKKKINLIVLFLLSNLLILSIIKSVGSKNISFSSLNSNILSKNYILTTIFFYVKRIFDF